MVSATVRDIAIIIIALQTIVIGVLLGVLIWQIWRLVKIVQTEVMPIIEDTQATVNTVRATATFVSDNVVDPVIQTNTRVTKWRTTSQALLRDLGFGKRRVAPSVPPPSAPSSNVSAPNISAPNISAPNAPASNPPSPAAGE